MNPLTGGKSVNPESLLNIITFCKNRNSTKKKMKQWGKICHENVPQYRKSPQKDSRPSELTSPLCVHPKTGARVQLNNWTTTYLRQLVEVSRMFKDQENNPVRLSWRLTLCRRGPNGKRLDSSDQTGIECSERGGPDIPPSVVSITHGDVAERITRGGQRVCAKYDNVSNTTNSSSLEVAWECVSWAENVCCSYETTW